MRAVVYARFSFVPLVVADLSDAAWKVLCIGDTVSIPVPVDIKPLYGRFAYRRVPLEGARIEVADRPWDSFTAFRGMVLFPRNSADEPFLRDAFASDQGVLRVVPIGGKIDGCLDG